VQPSAYPGQPISYPPPHAGGHQRLFQVRLRKHTGLVMAWYSQSYTVTGTFAQCEAAIRDAQQYNLLAGWWSVGSLVVWNWVALVGNFNARKTLRRHATQPYSACSLGTWPAPYRTSGTPRPPAHRARGLSTD
jgi:hypothetical protein